MRSLNCLGFPASIAYAKTRDEFEAIQRDITVDVSDGCLAEDDAAMLRDEIRKHKESDHADL